MKLEEFNLIRKKSQFLKETNTLESKFSNRSDDKKIVIIEDLFSKIMLELGLDLKDKSLRETPKRVAKMYVKEIFRGLDKKNKPQISLFDNKFGYEKMLTQSNINLISICEHHFLPFVGHAHLGYMSSGKIIGLSKLNRIVKFFSQRPQLQERLTKEIFFEIQNILNTESVIIIIKAKHLCISCRGVEDTSSVTSTMEYGGDFNINSKRDEFFTLIKNV